MSHVLSDLLGASEPGFTNSLRELEAESGQSGADMALISDIARKLRLKLRELGYDPDDTTAPELYYALQSLLQRHDQFLGKSLGRKPEQSVNESLTDIVTKVKSLPLPKNSWSLKPTAAKRLVRTMPPKKLMKLLNYRSVDSLLKRENVERIFAGIQLIESTSWKRRFIASYKQLKASDFEDRSIKFLVLTDTLWATPAKNYFEERGQNILALPELGTVAIMTLPDEPTSGATLLLLTWLLEAINEVRHYGSYFKLNQVKSDFADLVVKALLRGELGNYQLGKQNFNWRSLRYHYGQPGKRLASEDLGLYVQPEDVSWIDPHQLLYRIEPALSFWQGLGSIGMVTDGKPVSLNLNDVVYGLTNDVPYERRDARHLQSALWLELKERYLNQPSFEKLLIDQFSGDDGVDSWIAKEMWI